MGVRRLFTLDEGSSTVRVDEVLINHNFIGTDFTAPYSMNWSSD